MPPERECWLWPLPARVQRSKLVPIRPTPFPRHSTDDPTQHHSSGCALRHRKPVPGCFHNELSPPPPGPSRSSTALPAQRFLAISDVAARCRTGFAPLLTRLWHHPPTFVPVHPGGKVRRDCHRLSVPHPASRGPILHPPLLSSDRPLS